jgi:hypothetical protein
MQPSPSAAPIFKLLAKNSTAGPSFTSTSAAWITACIVSLIPKTNPKSKTLKRHSAEDWNRDFLKTPKIAFNFKAKSGGRSRN